MFGLGLPELIAIFLIILLLFGAKNLPGIARGIGESLKLFKKEIKDTENEVKLSEKEEDKKKENKIDS